MAGAEDKPMDNWNYWYRRYWDKSAEYWEARRESESKTWWMLGEALVICFCVAVIIYLTKS